MPFSTLLIVSSCANLYDDSLALCYCLCSVAASTRLSAVAFGGGPGGGGGGGERSLVDALAFARRWRHAPLWNTLPDSRFRNLG